MKKRLEKKKPDKIIVVSAAIIIVTLIIAIVFIFMPFLNEKRSLRSEILQERDKNILIGKIRALGKHLKVYKKRIPQGRDVSWLLREVSKMAGEEDIEMSSIKPSVQEERGLYSKLYVILDTVSSYHQLGRFISKVESYEKFLRVDAITISRLDIDEDIDEEKMRFKSFDVRGHIVISTVVFKE